ncbi:MAG: CDGSH iron-sulfur domain-containing protein [Arenicella sp.]
MKANVADTTPIQVELEAGKKYAWCTCGLSAKQPYCDGSHKETDFVPLIYQAKETGTQWLCMCKNTKKAPFCDGSHSDV